MPLTQLEENNLNTQIQLLNDIQYDNNMIEYYVSNEAYAMSELMRSAESKDGSFIMNSNDFKKVFGFLSIIKKIENWDEVHESVKSYAMKKSVNQKTLSLLTKTN